jgi:putative membrane protein
MMSLLVHKLLSEMTLFLLNGDGWHMMDWNHHMMDWWGIPYMGLWWFGIWIVQFIVAFFVYRDAEKKENNGLLWFILIFIPWIGIFFLIVYLILLADKTVTNEVISDAQKVLDERYAKGEISRNEYLQAKEDIREMK